jgi:hypothetical protein
MAFRSVSSLETHFFPQKKPLGVCEITRFPAIHSDRHLTRSSVDLATNLATGWEGPFLGFHWFGKSTRLGASSRSSQAQRSPRGTFFFLAAQRRKKKAEMAELSCQQMGMGQNWFQIW